jgi:hypothetical protein
LRLSRAVSKVGGPPKLARGAAHRINPFVAEVQCRLPDGRSLFDVGVEISRFLVVDMRKPPSRSALRSRRFKARAKPERLLRAQENARATRGQPGGGSATNAS